MESEPIDVEPILGSDSFVWADFGKGSVKSRTDNSQLQDFRIKLQDITKYHAGSVKKRKIIGLDNRAMTNSRQARTEIQPTGIFLCNNNGLQWYLLKCDYSTKDLSGNSYSSQYHRSGRTGGDAWDNNYNERKDFKSGSRYYLIGLDPLLAYPSMVFAESNYQTWGIAADGVKALKSSDDDVLFVTSKDETFLVAYITKCKGLDYILADKVYLNLTETGEEKLIDWIDNIFSRDVENYQLGIKAKKEVKTVEFDPLKVKYAQQFKDAKEILRVGHLRFARVSDANPQKTGNSVIDLIEWYGIIPVLNVPKTVIFDCNKEYFVHHTNSVCGQCKHDNLELPSGRYVIDIDSHCFYYHSNYKYKYTKKAWILSSLANMSVTIDNSVVDRIIPIGEEGIKVQGIAVEDDDFLNRF